MTKLLCWIDSRWLPLTYLMLAGILLLSLYPYAGLPSVPGTDKSHHLIAYGFLMFPTALRKPDRWLMIGVLFLAMSGAIEIIQPYVNRFGEWLDLAANGAGLICGGLAGHWLRAYLRRSPNKQANQETI